MRNGFILINFPPFLTLYGQRQKFTSSVNPVLYEDGAGSSEQGLINLQTR
jgi:hypothetical protein